MMSTIDPVYEQIESSIYLPVRFSTAEAAPKASGWRGIRLGISENEPPAQKVEKRAGMEMREHRCVLVIQEVRVGHDLCLADLQLPLRHAKRSW